MKRCPECRDLFEKERKRPDKVIEHDPYVDLVKAVIEQARLDINHNKRFEEGLEPREFIQNGGVQLWLRSIGIGVRPSMTKQIERMLR